MGNFVRVMRIDGPTPYKVLFYEKQGRLDRIQYYDELYRSNADVAAWLLKS